MQSAIAVSASARAICDAKHCCHHRDFPCHKGHTVSYIGRQKFLATLGGPVGRVAARGEGAVAGDAGPSRWRGRKHPPRRGSFYLCDERKIKGRFFRCRPYMLGGRRWM